MTRARRLLIAAVVALLAVPVMLAVDLSPAVGLRAAPTGEEVRAGRNALRRLRAATRAGPPNAAVAFSATDVGGIAALAGNGLRVRRVDARLDGGVLIAAASVRPLPWLWLNLRVATVPDGGPGFPALDASIGDLALPRWLTRLGLDGARRVAVLRGGRLPPLDTLVQRFAASPQGVALLVAAPLDGSGLMRQLVAISAAPVDAPRVAAIYCRLAAAQTQLPDDDLAVQVARALRVPQRLDDSVAEHRAALVALAMLTVGPRAADLADGAETLAAPCFIEPPQVRLGGRVDLAKHWVLSAALGATLGGDIGSAMGEWKELSDSLPGGSGFSFVDLAADRAGLRIGRALVRASSADAMRAALAKEPALLPLDATLLREGVTNDDFVTRYGSIDGQDYTRAVRQIDALLDREPMLLAAR